ncbi:hypothetical protein ACA689_000157 [Vibrio vulnificus]|uniref:hypothetical protein n=1 Tax=Vibrio vulnificus TaxID=672 RepID=UPI001A2A71FF|nr:hypothetical protein [Vibrio vulnificus]EHS1182146.1 hypothetical protein [Vibrio vulnificus]EID4418085.1 hypothetical protein [Vibrio vulnificus]ELH9601469.1 hypothetical protein [Vibrio vulnificus]ELL0557776.1 hypothetical protein [Vibrio vulnificus]ELU4007337.1 hypothetical protein [Vibrio vulnificus]
MKSCQKRLMNTPLRPSICLTLICAFFPSKASAALTIQDAIKLWVSNGSNFSSLNTCSIHKELRNTQLIVNADSSCNIRDLATYVLLKECVTPQNITQVTIFDGVGDKPSLSFDIDRAACKFLTTQLSSMQEQGRKITDAKAMKHYVIQFYAGKREPRSTLGKCADIPLYLHVEDSMFYLMSAVYEQYSEAKKIMSTINDKCNSIDLWIRPISVTQY